MGLYLMFVTAVCVLFLIERFTVAVYSRGHLDSSRCYLTDYVKEIP